MKKIFEFIKKNIIAAIKDLLNYCNSCVPFVLIIILLYSMYTIGKVHGRSEVYDLAHKPYVEILNKYVDAKIKYEVYVRDKDNDKNGEKNERENNRKKKRN